MESNVYLTVQEAAQQLGITDGAVRLALHKGRLAGEIKYGRRVITEVDVEAYRRRTQPDGVKRTGRPPKRAEASAETARLAAEGLRHIWDTPEEDRAWAYLQEVT